MITGIGIVVRDVTARVGRFPGSDEKLAAEAWWETPGGPVPMALLAAARLGVPAALVGVVGDDPAGRLVREVLAAEGIDLRHLLVRPRLATPTSMVIACGDHRAIVECGQAQVAAFLGEELVPMLGDRLAETRFLLVDARFPALQEAAAREVRRCGGRVVLDAGHPRPGVDALLPLADVAVLSRTWGDRQGLSPEEALDRVAAAMPAPGEEGMPGARRGTIAGITLGPEGVIARIDRGPVLRIPGHRVTAVDTAGAGDVFHGVLVAALWRGEPPERALRLANAAAALKVQRPTASAPIGGWSDIESLL